MAMQFKNQANGYTETVGVGAAFAMLLLGAAYLAYRGLWGHFAAWMLVLVPAAVASGGPGALVWIPASIVYAFSIHSILRKDYLRKGWVEV